MNPSIIVAVVTAICTFLILRAIGHLSLYAFRTMPRYHKRLIDTIEASAARERWLYKARNGEDA